MILTGSKIISSVEDNDIEIHPFTTKNVSTNSYDLCLGEKYIRYLDDVLDPKKNNKYVEETIPSNGLVMNKGDFILAESMEIIGSSKFVPIIHGKSGIARQGLFIHITADLIDIGYKGKITFQMYATHRMRLYSKMRIAQVSFWMPSGNIKLYDGKYQNGIGPQPSKTYIDMNT